MQQTRMNTKQTSDDAMSSKRQPALKCPAARAPNTIDITEEELAGLALTSSASSSSAVTTIRSYPLTHHTGACNHLSVCDTCISLKKIIKIMRKLPHESEKAIEAYFVVLGKMPTHQYCARIAQDELTLEKQTVTMHAQFARGYTKYHDHIGSSYRANMLRNLFSSTHDKKQTRQERMAERDRKYEFETDRKSVV